jgi:formylglycine-generating enzyme
MLGKHSLFLRWVVVVLAGCALRASAGVFNMPAGQTSLQFVPVGDPGNEPDSTGYGAVPYTYQMGEFDVTVAQYTQFLNSIAASDPYGLYSPSMTPGAAIGSCGITRSGNSGDYTYSYATASSNFPVNAVSWLSAARFCNWLDNGQPASGLENAGSTEDGSYTLNGATGAMENDQQLSEISRSPNAVYVIPTENEWYKAAYYKGGSTNAGYWLYPTQNNATPSNVLSMTGANNANYYDSGYTDPVNFLTSVGAFADSPGPYGTYDMGGDVYQWTEGIDNSLRILRGGSFVDGADDLASSSQFASGASQIGVPIGFRIAEVPEPASLGIGMLAFLIAMQMRRPLRRGHRQA